MTASPVRFHVMVHPDTRDAPRIGPIVVTSRLRSACFPITFDEVAKRLQEIDRLLWEPDGSFSWTGPADRGPSPWRVNGQLTDGGRQLACMELSGYCRASELDVLLQSLNWPVQPVVFQLVRAGVFIDEAEFRSAYCP